VFVVAGMFSYLSGCIIWLLGKIEVEIIWYNRYKMLNGNQFLRLITFIIFCIYLYVVSKLLVNLIEIY